MVAVSIIVPTYNSIGTLDRAIDSVLLQSMKNWELILVDDASQDGTVGLMRQKYGADPRFKFIVKKENSGPSESRNLGIIQASGEWIALLDSDDAWRPDRMERLLGVASGYDFVADNVMTYDVAARLETGPYYQEFQAPVVTLEDYLLGWVGEHPMDGGYLKPLMRTEFLQSEQIRYNKGLRHGEDYLMYCEALCCGARVALLNGCGYIYSTPVGWQSKKWSPHTHTAPDPVAMSLALTDLRMRFASTLTDAEKKAFHWTVDRLSMIKPWWDFEDALRTRRYSRCFFLLKHEIVRREFLAAFRRKLSGLQPTRPLV